MDYESLPLLGGPFEPVETYVYLDGRQTFSIRSTTLADLYYIVNTVDESDDDDTLTALAVAVNGDRFRAIRSGIVPFRDAFGSAPRFALYSIVWKFSGELHPSVEVSEVQSSSIPNRWLPSEGARLNIPTQTVKPFVPDELLRLADAQARTIYALEVGTPDSRITGFPTRNAGELQVAVDGEIAALTKEVVGPKASVISQEIHSSTLGLRAASFVLILGIDTVGSMVEATDVTSKVFERFNALVASVRQGDDAFLAEIQLHGSTVRNRFLDILESVANVGSGVALSSVVAHSRRLVQASASPDQVRSAVSAIRNVKPQIQRIQLERGILTGLVLRRKRFEIVDAVNPLTAPYKGAMSDDATAQANGLRVGDESFIKAMIRVEIPFAGEDDSTGTKYILESIQPFDTDERIGIRSND